MGIYQSSDKKVRVVLGNEEVEAAVIDGRVHFEGDIIVPEEDDDAGGRAGRALFGRSVRLWEKGIIPYTLDDRMGNVSLRIVRSAIQHWERKTDIRFVERTNEKDWVEFRKGAGCASSVGRIGGRQFITVGAGCGTPQTIHEIGHCVGMWHEQSRADRDEHVQIVWDEIQSGQRQNFKKHDHDKMIGPYDFFSVMHYESRAFAKRGRPTILKLDGSLIGNRGVLSAGDVAAVQQIYAEEFTIRAQEEAAPVEEPPVEEPPVEEPPVEEPPVEEPPVEEPPVEEPETETPEIEIGNEDPPVQSPELLFHEGRFKAQVIWKTVEGNTGLGFAVPGATDRSGLFWFFNKDNWEMLVKLADGTKFNGHWWVFVAAATDVEWNLQIEDSDSGLVWSHQSALGERTSVADIEAIQAPGEGPQPPVDTGDAAPVPELLLHERFKVTVQWTNQQGETGPGFVVPGASAKSGLFWFFRPQNWEMMVKVIDGRPLTGHWWVFAAAATDVEWKLEIEDTKTGEVVWTHENPQGTLASIAETKAFEAS